MGGLEDGAQRLVVVDHRGRVLLVAGVGRDVLHGPRPVEGDDRHEVVERGGTDLAQGLFHAAALELERAGRVAAGQHLVGLGVVERQRRHVDAYALALLDQHERRLDDVEVAQAQEVHLEQAERGHVVHAELGDHLGVALLLQRDVLGERQVGDDDAGGVDGVVADEALERHGKVDHLARGLVFVVGRP